ncbi:MAG: DUF692 domain-containing protein [Pseudomonadales bacterium]|nr:DUF692 domain-containing protein [Pseudomonadales bacterium]
MMLLKGMGAGIGLRIPHIQTILRDSPEVPWFEVHICNFLRGGLNRQLLRLVGQQYPLSFHGVSMNLGGVDPLDLDYLQRLRRAVEEFMPFLISEHACFTAHQNQHFHDLLPVPYTKNALINMADRVDQVQNILGRQILVENVSRYFSYPQSEMCESEFLMGLCQRTGCGLLLDLNNAFVNQCNHGESVADFIAGLPLAAIGEVHLAGHTQQGDIMVDTHSQRVAAPVWQIYREFTELCPDVPCLIEWDSELPDFNCLNAERNKAQSILSGIEGAVKWA